MAKLRVPDAWRLVNACSGGQPLFANAFVVKFDPSFEHIDHLEFDFVVMSLRLHRRARYGANDVSNHTTIGGITNTQVAVFEERAQAVFFEIGFVVIAARELHRMFHRFLLFGAAA